ncbi:tyrosine-type recombinase/integrase [Limosilactobacillus fermentum]
MVMDEELEAAFLKEQERRLAASTIAGYGRNLNFVRRSYQGEWPGWVHLSTTQIRAFFVRRQKEGVSVATTRYQATTLRRFYHYLLEQGLVDQNPLVGIQFDEVGGARGNLPNYQLLMESIEQNSKRATLLERVATYLVIETGMRTGELIALCWGQVDVTMKMVLIKGEDQTERYVPLPDDLLGLLSQLEAAYATTPTVRERVLTLANGKPVSRSWVERTVRRVSGGATPATLRHAYLNKVVLEQRLEDANRLAGHKTLVATAGYQQGQVQDLKKKYQQYF